jgi:hypothetical protein
MFATSMLPMILVMHFGGGLLMYGYPQFYGNQGQDDNRIKQKHIFIYWVMSAVIVFIFFFEAKLVWLWRISSNAFIKCCGRNIAR